MTSGSALRPNAFLLTVEASQPDTIVRVVDSLRSHFDGLLDESSVQNAQIRETPKTDGSEYYSQTMIVSPDIVAESGRIPSLTVEICHHFRDAGLHGFCAQWDERRMDRRNGVGAYKFSFR